LKKLTCRSKAYGVSRSSATVLRAAAAGTPG
jgi:hypothetical protein